MHFINLHESSGFKDHIEKTWKHMKTWKNMEKHGKTICIYYIGFHRISTGWGLNSVHRDTVFASIKLLSRTHFRLMSPSKSTAWWMDSRKTLEGLWKFMSWVWVEDVFLNPQSTERVAPYKSHPRFTAFVRSLRDADIKGTRWCNR